MDNFQNQMHAHSNQTFLNNVRHNRISTRTSQLSADFGETLTPILAQNGQNKEICYALRYQVYCREMHYIPEQTSQLEQDKADEHSYHCLMQHRSSQRFAGTIRVVSSNSAEQQLPMEEHCGSRIQDFDIKPSDFPRESICEISRLAVLDEFRHPDRATAKDKLFPFGQTYSDKERRCFPLIALGLYLSAAKLCQEHDIEHVFAMMEPRLARNLMSQGFPFRQIGSAMEYHGQRAPFYIGTSEFFSRLPGHFKKLYQQLENDLMPQLYAP